jgi:hypothetical protein
MTRPTLFATGASSGFSLTALGGVLTHTNWVSILSFIGSATATGVSWYLSRRYEIARAELELKHIEAQAERDEKVADALADLRVRKIQAELTDSARAVTDSARAVTDSARAAADSARERADSVREINTMPASKLAQPHSEGS